MCKEVLGFKNAVFPWDPGMTLKHTMHTQERPECKSKPVNI